MSESMPCLPQHAPAPEARADALAAIREQYQYDYAYQSLCFVKDLPKQESFSPHYMKQALQGMSKIHLNHARFTGRELLDGLHGSLAHARDALTGHAQHDHPQETLLSALREASDTTRASSTATFAAMFKAIEAPACAPIYQEDWAFAWQRIAGAVPVLIRSIDRLPANFPVTQQHFERALGAGHRLDAALSEGRLFLCDYAMFDGIPTGTYPPQAADGIRKFLQAPLALFCATPTARGGLAPVAIQCEQRPGPDNPIYTPADGARWAFAKALVQIADANLEGITVHFGYCHMLIERFVLAARRHLSPQHPLLQLLAPHFEFTLAANQHAASSLVVPNGTQDRILSPTLPATLSVLRDGVRSIELADLDPTVDFARRGTHSRDALPAYPFRDDGLETWAAIHRWVDAYVRLYYLSDADAAGDFELRAMLDEIGSLDGGQLPRLVAGEHTDTVSRVIELAARVIFRASTYHAAINYNWWDWMGFVPNMPSVGCRGPLDPHEDANADTLLELLPPMGVAWETIAQIFGVNSIWANTLGGYPASFDDPRVAPLLANFRSDLVAANDTIKARNLTRPIAYNVLRPPFITASINS